MTDDIQRHLHAINGGKYKIIKQIGKGAFGEAFKVVKPSTGEFFAVKTENIHCKYPMLFNECKIYNRLEGGAGIPKIDFFTREGEYDILVMELLGKSLQSLLESSEGKKLSLKTVLMLTIQMIQRLEQLHNRDYIHRDIKPDNFLMGRGVKEKECFMIDLGLADKYRDLTTHEHISFSEHKGVCGTARYMSIHSHLGHSLSRRDDLEGLGYVVVYLHKGTLPWQGLRPVPSPHRIHEVFAKMKLEIPEEQLCCHMPPEFATYFKFVKTLHFNEKPDYAYLRTLFHSVMEKLEFRMDWRYDWTPPEPRHPDSAQRGSAERGRSGSRGSTERGGKNTDRGTNQNNRERSNSRGGKGRVTSRSRSSSRGRGGGGGGRGTSRSAYRDADDRKKKRK